ncbi:histidine phosphatase superfamily protein (branch 1) [Algoriphagus ratkowskyi]|uniref:Histidine phosphatase family protein n=1 Tax=Algoriphagus ratkowskyi TaxID=57028 RepID=A0A2W7S9U5_9BACT|nr:phosphoglycerate mutase family protein [Algoriphagus ratkowskyi]PZX59635.1 histidine phosphatase superfamily protein (branch 1) [Algoriphagus ratkowskyi]TXD78643.1 histidine phosphatase family protein [Algoriphagus ratkowskyi]
MKYFLVLLFATLFAACSSKQEPKTIYIVRHAEKQLTGDDPLLSVAGNARAVKLSQILSGKDIKHIYSTDYNRTKLTVAQTASEAGVQVETYDAKNHDALVKKIRSVEGNVLVVGHSNTVGQIANYFVGDGKKYEDLDDSEYNYIYVVKVEKNGTSTVVTKTYKDY